MLLETESRFNLIKENFERIIYDINDAKSKYRKDTDIVELMAVTKTVPYELVNYAIDLGINILGENRVQEFISKYDYYKKPARIDFIGNLQTNKVKYIIDKVSIIHSVDSVKLAKEINRLAEKNDLTKDILIEINIGNEDTKGGINPTEIFSVLDEISSFKNINIKGLMTIPPKINVENYFYQMQQLYIDIIDKKLDNINMSILSMGMSSDYKMAIKYGSNIVRIGSALFGNRI